MFRRRRRSPAVPREGDMVIDGHVTARLLGMRLLDLEAHVVVGTVSDTARAALRSAPAITARSAEAPTDGDRRGVGNGAGGRDLRALPLARAQQLLAEGTTVLAEARRIR
jgi:hypothetical protein